MTECRRPVTRAILLITAIAAALALAACGSDDDSGDTATQETTVQSVGAAPIGASARSCPTDGALTELRAAGVGCDTARKVMVTWNQPRCLPESGASRSQCTVGGYRCQAVRTERGLAVSCARPGKSISFLRRR
jgi:hypothetical protein